MLSRDFTSTVLTAVFISVRSLQHSHFVDRLMNMSNDYTPSILKDFSEDKAMKKYYVHFYRMESILWI